MELMSRTTRSIVAAGLAIATVASTSSIAVPPAAAKPNHTVSVWLTGMHVLNSEDWDSCGEFNEMRAKVGYSSITRRNVIPVGAKKELWRPTALGGRRGTFRLCEGNYYSVQNQASKARSESLEGWAWTGLFAKGLDPTPENVAAHWEIKAAPGSQIVMSFAGQELDYTVLWGARTRHAFTNLEAPPPGKAKNLRMKVYFDRDKYNKTPLPPTMELDFTLRTSAEKS